jgi:hypothetical protein
MKAHITLRRRTRRDIGHGAGAQQKSPAPGPCRARDGEGDDRVRDLPGGSAEDRRADLALVKRNFYNGQRFHRAEKNFVIQIGDPQEPGRQPGGAGVVGPVGQRQADRRRPRSPRSARTCAVPWAWATRADPKAQADSQFYITLRVAPELDGKYTRLRPRDQRDGRRAKIERGDVLRRAYLKE